MQRGRSLGADIEFVLTKRYSFATDVPPSLVRFVSHLHDATPLDVLAELFPAFDAHDKLAALDVLNGVETLILGGERDLMTPADHSRAMVEQVPGAELVILPEAGHLVMLEHHDIVTDRLRDLIERAVRHRTASPRRDGRPMTTDTVLAAASATSWDDLSTGCRAASPAPSWPRAAAGSSPGSGRPVPTCCWSARRPARRRTRPGCRSSAGPGSCSTSCSPKPGCGASRSRWRTCSSAGRRRTASRAGPRWPAAGPGCSGSWTWSTRWSWWPWAAPPRSGSSARAPGSRCSASRAGTPLRHDGRRLLVSYHPSAAIRFGPRGAPVAALREDLAEVARLVAGPAGR